MAEMTVRPSRFVTQPGEVRLGRIKDGRWRPLTVAEAEERGVTVATYNRKTGKVLPTQPNPQALPSGTTS